MVYGPDFTDEETCGALAALFQKIDRRSSELLEAAFHIGT